MPAILPDQKTLSSKQFQAVVKSALDGKSVDLTFGGQTVTFNGALDYAPSDLADLVSRIEAPTKRDYAIANHLNDIKAENMRDKTARIGKLLDGAPLSQQMDNTKQTTHDLIVKCLRVPGGAFDISKGVCVSQPAERGNLGALSSPLPNEQAPDEGPGISGRGK